MPYTHEEMQRILAAVNDYAAEMPSHGEADLETAIANRRARLQRLFELAKIPNGHAHRFRDTFAVELLLAGVPIERVSVLLGHQSVRITAKHYSPWAKSRQEQLEADLRKAWKNDPLAQETGEPRFTASTQESENLQALIS